MVYYTETLETCHELTDSGLEEYGRMLELKADELLFRSKHPFRYWWRRLANLVKFGDSTWDGANYPPEEKYKDGYSYTK